jgi:hypothetical protein
MAEYLPFAARRRTRLRKSKLYVLGLGLNAIETVLIVLDFPASGGRGQVLSSPEEQVGVPPAPPHDIPAPAAAGESTAAAMAPSRRAGVTRLNRYESAPPYSPAR